MKRHLLMLLASCTTLCGVAQHVTSPDGRLAVDVAVADGRASYCVTLDGDTVVLPSALGLRTSIGDYTDSLTLAGSHTSDIDTTYTMTRTKASSVHYTARRLDVELRNAKGWPLTVTLQVSDTDVALRYTLGKPTASGTLHYAIVRSEATALRLPDGTTTFLSPQIGPMTGWERTKPSYEEEYEADAPMAKASRYGEGYTFPCLFHLPRAWMLVSETGVTSGYCGSHLSDYREDTGYVVAYPNAGENNGFGSAEPCLPLPGSTPWRTITVGRNLRTIAETTVAYDVVEPLYEPSHDYKPGRYTWSWLIWQDNSINYDDQVRFVDLAAAMGFEYCLVDGCWDETIGRERIADLSAYAQTKGVRLLLWYNSNGFVNNAYQTPRHCMTTALAREREMAWMEQAGIAGIKVDFFGGDKQETMRLYEDILADANRHGLQVIFHGCTLPRGWERMYPNYVASEAALASENVYFTDHHARREGFELTMHPFCRNAVASFDWGGIILNRYMSKDNRSRHARRTTDIFELASGIVIQTSVNCVALQPNNLTDVPQFELDFLRSMPTTWDEERLLDGYPTRYVVVARRRGDAWYVAGLNGTDAPITLMLDLPMLAGQTVSCYIDRPLRGKAAAASIVGSEPTLTTLKIGKDGRTRITLQPMGGLVLVQ